MTEDFRLESTFTMEQLKKEFFVEAVEVRNETDKPIFATAVKSELTGQLYVHIFEDEGYKIKPHDYRLVPIKIEKLELNKPNLTEKQQ